MLKVVVNNKHLKDVSKPKDSDKPCPHGFAVKGNCTKCSPPPNYVPLNGPAK